MSQTIPKIWRTEKNAGGGNTVPLENKAGKAPAAGYSSASARCRDGRPGGGKGRGRAM